MDFPFDGAVSKETSLVVATFQAAGAVLLALLLRLLARGIPGRFLQYWSVGWVALGAAVLSLALSFVLSAVAPPLAARFYRPSLMTYCVCEYVFGFCLWAGCRAYARGAPLRNNDYWLLAGPVAFGLTAPVFVPNINVLFPFHAAVFAGFCLLAGLATRAARPTNRQNRIGLRLLQFATGGLAALFSHYAVVMGWVQASDPGRDVQYLHYAALYDGLVETLLAFGMVVLGTDRVRLVLEAANQDLAQANRRLAEASAQLAVAARTDPLTGLLNRRAYEGMLLERGDAPFAGSVAVVDLNLLKQINDGHGHAAGDAAIQFVARALRGQFRITDPIFRMGGDEFLVVLEGGRTADLSRRLESVDVALRGLRLPGIPEQVDLVIAWGMADFTSAADFPNATSRADQAMYACKSLRKGARAEVE